MIEGVSAVVVTRGDVTLAPILAELHAQYDDVVIWNNSNKDQDVSVFGRYCATYECQHPLVYFQDDDIVFTEHEALKDEWDARYGWWDEDPMEKADMMLCNMDEPWVDRGNYQDLGLLGMGGLMPRFGWEKAAEQYLTHWPADKFFYDWCDFAVGVLSTHTKVDLGYEVRDVAHSGTRLAHGPGNRVLKNAMIARAWNLV
jgi:hypothetical protein